MPTDVAAPAPIKARPRAPTPAERMKLAWIEGDAKDRSEFLKWISDRGEVVIQRTWRPFR